MPNPLTASSIILDTGVLSLSGNQLLVNGLLSTHVGVSFNVQTGPVYLVTTNDSFNTISMSGTVPQQVILPSGNGFVAGTQVLIERFGTGVVNIGTTGAVIMQSRSGVSGIAAQFSIATAILRNNTTWLVAGDMM